jgi:hypothetical protein
MWEGQTWDLNIKGIEDAVDPLPVPMLMLASAPLLMAVTAILPGARGELSPSALLS